MIRLRMKNFNMILLEKLQYQPYHQAKLISMNILQVKKMLPSNQKQITEQAKFTYSPLGKAFKKQTKTIKGQGERQVDALKPLESSDKQLSSVKDFISKEKLNPEIINELKRTEEEEKEDDRSKIIYKGYNKTYDFRKFKTLRVFGNNIRNNFININIANDE